jgi:hypothetical protein
MMLRTVGANSATQKTPCCHMLGELTDTWIPDSICLTVVSKNDGMQSNKHTILHAKMFQNMLCHYAAAHVAARPIARHHPAIIVIAFLRCIAIAMLPLNSRAMISCGDEVALSRLANMMFE